MLIPLVNVQTEQKADVLYNITATKHSAPRVIWTNYKTTAAGLWQYLLVESSNNSTTCTLLNMAHEAIRW